MVEAASDEPTPAPAIRGRVLLVDDDILLRRSLAKVLSRGGYHVIAAASADEARLAWDQWGGFTAVITDLVMPGDNGVELSEELRSRNPRLPVVLITGGAPRTVLQAASDAGYPVLSKPFSPDALLAAVASAIEASSQA